MRAYQSNHAFLVTMGAVAVSAFVLVAGIVAFAWFKNDVLPALGNIAAVANDYDFQQR